MEEKDTKSKLDISKKNKYYSISKYIVIGILCLGIGGIIGNNLATEDYNELVDEYNNLYEKYEENKV